MDPTADLELDQKTAKLVREIRVVAYSIKYGPQSEYARRQRQREWWLFGLALFFLLGQLAPIFL